MFESIRAVARVCALIAMSAAGAACSSLTDSGSSAPVASVEVVLTPATVAVGESATATAIVKDSSGKTIKAGNLVWSAGAGVTLTQAGVVSAKSLYEGGYATVRATVGMVSGDATLRIVRLPASRIVPYISPNTVFRNGVASPPDLPGLMYVALTDSVGTVFPRKGVVITASVAGATLTTGNTATTSEGGLAGFPNPVITGTSGVKTFSFSAPGFPTVTVPIRLVSGVASTLAITTGNNQTQVVGRGTTPISVVVNDADNYPVPNVAVTFSVATGGGNFDGVSGRTSVVKTTGADGVAVLPSWVLGTYGANTLSAKAAGIATAVTISAFAEHRVTALSISFPQATISVGQSVQANITALDENGTPFTPAAAGREWYATGPLSTTQTGIVTGIGAGSATSILRILGVTASADLIVTGSTTKKLVLAQRLTGAHIGNLLAIQPVVQIVDVVTGAPVNEAGHAITIVHSPYLATPSTLSGTLTVLTDATGTARFTDLGVVGPSGSIFSFDFLSNGILPVWSGGLSKP